MIGFYAAGAMGSGGTPPSGHSTDFSEYSTGVAPSDWTPRWVTSGATYTVEEFGGANVLRADVFPNGRYAISWDKAGSSVGDVEVLAKVRFASALSTNQTGPRIVIRGGGSAANEEGYTGQLRNQPDQVEVMKIVSGTFGAIGSSSMSVQDSRWYWLRMRVEGTSIKAKCWVDGDSEPGAWGIDETDASLSSGWIGFGAQTGMTYYCGFFSYNDEGGSAPGP